MSNLSKCLHAFTTQLLHGGVQHAVICPGSRNFPLMKTFTAANDVVKIHSCVDERSAGFVALGLAQQTRSPVVLCCTSGTAVLNFYPAIAEAFYSETPLIVLTADRPPESIDNWEGQTIRQKDVFQNHIVSAFETPGMPDEVIDFVRIANNVVDVLSAKPGPVHINMPFKEPFYEDWLKESYSMGLKADVSITYEDFPDMLKKAISSSKRILWLNGASLDVVTYDYPDNLVVWSDVVSNKNQSTAYWENVLSANSLHWKDMMPDLIISTGKYFVSRLLLNFLRQDREVTHWHLGTQKNIPTPFMTKPLVVNCRVQEILQYIKNNYTESIYKHEIDCFNQKISGALDDLDWDYMSEFGQIKRLYEMIPASSVIQISNSMPIRYVSLLDRRNDLIHIANRGTSGIDGCTSTAVGYAKASNEVVFLFTGDLAFLYDINGLWQEDLPSNLRIVVFNNHGGGIFELIDGPNDHIDSLPLQTTNHNRSMRHLAGHFAIDYLCIDDESDSENLISTFLMSTKPVILEIQTRRQDNNAFFNRYKNTVNEAILNGK